MDEGRKAVIEKVQSTWRMIVAKKVKICVDNLKLLETVKSTCFQRYLTKYMLGCYMQSKVKLSISWRGQNLGIEIEQFYGDGGIDRELQG